MQSFCDYYNRGTCHSCDLIQLDYPAQIKLKLKTLQDTLNTQNQNAFLPPVLSPEQHFRNKAKMVVTGTVDEPVIGLMGTDDLDQGRELLKCPLHLQPMNELLLSIKEFIKLTNLAPYNISQKKGELKNLILFYSEDSKEGYLRFVLRSKEAIDRIKKHSPSLAEKHPFLKCISINIQPIPHAILEGPEEIFLTETHFIFQDYSEFRLKLDPRGFVQTNQFVAKKLYATAAQWVKETGSKKFLELFCGQGAFSFHCSKFIDQGLGVEINESAVKEANATAFLYQLKHLQFMASDAAHVAKNVEDFSPDIILVNPPRRGLGESLDVIRKQRPKHFIYSSCNYLTLSSDLEALKSLYEIEKIQLFDMFPHSKHFETLVQLKFKSS